MSHVGSASRSSFLFEHDLFGKPVSAFPDHALGVINKPAPQRGENVNGDSRRASVLAGRQDHSHCRRRERDRRERSRDLCRPRREAHFGRCGRRDAGGGQASPRRTSSERGFVRCHRPRGGRASCVRCGCARRFDRVLGHLSLRRLDGRRLGRGLRAHQRGKRERHGQLRARGAAANDGPRRRKDRSGRLACRPQRRAFVGPALCRIERRRRRAGLPARARHATFWSTALRPARSTPA